MQDLLNRANINYQDDMNDWYIHRPGDTIIRELPDIFLGDDDDYIPTNRRHMIRGIYYNLPEDKWLREQIEMWLNGGCSSTYIPLCIAEYIRSFPFKWFSILTTAKVDPDDDILIIDPDYTLPQLNTITFHFYAKYFETAGYGRYLHKAPNEYATYPGQTLNDFINDIEKNDETIGISGNNFYIGDKLVYLFDGITLRDFAKFYFTTRLPKEDIFRVFKEDTELYKIDYMKIEEEVEKILSKHD